MKIIKPFIAILFIAIALNSCKKNNDNKPVATTSSSMVFTANGTAVNFNTCAEVDISINNINQIAFSATNLTNGKAGASSFSISIIHDPATIKAGQTYPVTSSSSQSDAALLTYFVSDSETDITQYNNPQGSVTITDVTSAYIKGTFSGKLFADDDLDGKTVTYTITNGSFTAQRAN